MLRSQPINNFSSTTHVHFLRWLYGIQQQQQKQDFNETYKNAKKCVYSWRHLARAAVTDLGRREFGLVAQRAAGPQRTDTRHIFRTLHEGSFIHGAFLKTTGVHIVHFYHPSQPL